MSSLTQRMAMAESRLDRHSSDIAALREDIRRFETRVDQRFAAIDLRFDGIDRRFESVENRIGLLDQKLDQRFAWLIGIQVLTLLSVFSAAAAIFTR